MGRGRAKAGTARGALRRIDRSGGATVGGAGAASVGWVIHPPYAGRHITGPNIAMVLLRSRWPRLQASTVAVSTRSLCAR
jgi:hypothetical protein